MSIYQQGGCTRHKCDRCGDIFKSDAYDAEDIGLFYWLGDPSGSFGWGDGEQLCEDCSPPEALARYYCSECNRFPAAQENEGDPVCCPRCGDVLEAIY